MNNITHVRGRKRDLKVLNHLEVLKCLSQDQIHILEFWNVSREMSYRCTQRLIKGEYIKRGKLSYFNEPNWFYHFDEKRPRQIEHQLGKSWIYTALNMRMVASEGKEKLIYYKDEEKKFLPILQSDGYGVIEKEDKKRNHIWTEFQVTESNNGFKKDYAKLFENFAEDEILTLIVVTTGSYDSIKKSLNSKLAEFKNVKLEFYTLDKLKEYTWRIAEEMRNKYRQQQLNDRKEIMTWEFGMECGKQQAKV